jgi:hypothetical protein
MRQSTGRAALVRAASAFACVAAAAAAAQVVDYYPGTETWHQTGFGVGSAWEATVSNKSAAFLTYGPYATDLPRGVAASATFFLVIDNNKADALNVVNLDVHDAATDTILASRSLLRTDFEVAGGTVPFGLYFTTPAGAASLEFRVYYVCCSAIVHIKTEFRALDSGRMGEFWTGGAHFAFTSTAVFPTPGQPPSSAGANVGFYFLPLGGVWYLFHREYFYMPQPSYCVADFARIVVRTSSDHGRRWSNATAIIPNVPGTPTECAVVDGAAHYDAATSEWSYIGQCMDRARVWNMCVFTATGATPLQPFAAHPGNPVVRGGQLWRCVCSGYFWSPSFPGCAIFQLVR